MAKKKEETKSTKPNSKITAPDLYAINKIKTLRNILNISQPDIDRDTELSIGRIGKVENSSTNTKFALGELNMLVKYFNKKQSQSESAIEESALNPSLNINKVTVHDLLPSIPLINKEKINKDIIDCSKSIGPLDAIRFLIEINFLKELVKTDTVITECERIFNKKFMRDSIRNSLDYFVKTEPLLEKETKGKIGYYKLIK